jgi:phosphoglycolate phosphatase
MNHALGLRGFPLHSMEAHRFLVGEGIEQLAQKAMPPGQDDQIQSLIDDYRRHYAEHALDQTAAFEGVPELLDALAGQGIALAVLSNKRHDFTTQVVKHALSRWRFGAVYGERTSVPRKPDPQAALEIARELQVKPERCAFVGDTSIDMGTARAAGMFAVGVLWGFRDERELRDTGAQAIIRHPRELLSVELHP